MNFIKALKRRKLLYISVVVVIFIILFFVFRGAVPEDVDVVTVQRETLTRQIDVTGRVKPADSIDLAFESSGRVSGVYKDTGDRVSSGETLARLYSGSVSADLAQARARLKSEEAKLLAAKAGARPEEITVQEVKVKSAESALAEVRYALIDEISTSYTKADDAVRNKVDQLFSNASTDNPKLIITTTQGQLKIDVESKRVLIGQTLNSWKNSLDSLSINSDLQESSQISKRYLDEIRNFLDKMSVIVNTLEANQSLSQTQIDSYKADVSTARTSIDGALSALSTDNEKLNTAISSLNLAKEELTLMRAGDSLENILSQEAKVEEAEANVLKYQAELTKSVIFSPISGVITNVLISVGETVSQGVEVISLISDKNLQIEANVPESDIIFLKVGDEADVELDAYGSDIIFSAKILKIDPAETIIDGVPVYKTTFEFVDEDARVRSGMTADISIVTDQKENSLAVPKRAVFKEEERTYVRLWVGEEIEERNVKLGFEGNDGKVEIVEGLKEGDEVVTFIKK